ncbi:MAG: hypothetical protein ACJ790_09810 [Myxococcaceae bacterium]
MKRLLVVVALVAASVAAAEDVKLANRQESFGAGMTPPVLPSGSTAAYGFVGAQEIGGGYRYGTGGFELEGRGRFNYLLLSFGGEAIGKYQFLTRDRVEVGASLGLGLGYDSGARYFDIRNFRALLLRVEPGVVGSYRIHDTLRGFALLNAPLDFGIAPTGGYHVQILAGGGVEFYLGEDLSLFAMGSIGPDVMREPVGLALWQIGYSVKVGVGYRMF